MPTVLVLSPHLDDAAFSCGGAMAQLADAGWRVVMATAFTRSIHPATGFALACQLDKGLPPSIDYMALRRAEDRTAATHLGAEPRHLDLPEAPHRGYNSAPALFGPLRDGDDVWQPLSTLLADLIDELHPALILAPQGLGNHVDHHQVIRATLHAATNLPLAFYRDTPYAIRNAHALQNVTLPALEETLVEIESGLSRKIAASCAYESQVGFQFGGAGAAAEALRTFAMEEGRGKPAERYKGSLTQV